jgi:hypothetical protein
VHASFPNSLLRRAGCARPAGTSAIAPRRLAPGGGLDLEPIPAFSGPIGRIAALAHHSFEAAFLGRTQQRQPVYEGLARTAGQPKRSNSACKRLSPHERLRTKITAVDRK